MTEKSITVTRKTPCGDMTMVAIVQQNGVTKLSKILLSMANNGTCAYAQAESHARCVNLALDSGADPLSIIKALSGLRCGQETDGKLSCSHAIAKGVKHVLKQIGQYEADKVA